MNSESTPILGIDVGGVIIDKAADGTDTSFFGDRFLETPEVEGAIDTIASLVRDHFAGRGFVVSKCGKNVERKTRDWLHSKDFVARTGIPEDRWNFVRKREEKAPICARLGITCFVDDRLEVLGYLGTVDLKILFRADEEEVAMNRQHLHAVVRAAGWAEVRRLVEADPAE